MLFASNPYIWDGENAGEIGSKVMSLKIFAAEKQLNISNQSKPIRMNIPNEKEMMKKERVKLYDPGKWYHRQYNVSTAPILFIKFNSSDIPKDVHVSVNISLSEYGREHASFPVNLSDPFNKNTEFEGGSDSRRAQPRLQFLDEGTVRLRLSDEAAENSSVALAFAFQGKAAPSALVGNKFTFDTLKVRVPWNLTIEVGMPSCKFWNEMKNGFDVTGCEVGNQIMNNYLHMQSFLKCFV